MLRGCLTTGGVLLVMAVVGIVYLVLNPPLKPPETGYLSSSQEIDLRLDASNPTAAFRVRFGAPDEVYTGASVDFPPLHVTASLADVPTDPAEVRLWLTSHDGLPVTGLEASGDGTQLSWEADCQSPGVVSGCTREILLVVAGTRMSGDRAATKINLFAEQRFPTHVPTPFLVSLDLSAEPVAVASGERLMAAFADGSHRLSPAQAVVRWTLNAEDTEGPMAGSWLTVEVDHHGLATPAGFDASAPVAVGLVDRAGEVVVTAEVRPGSPRTVALPPLDGEYTVVGWWQDRVADSYDLRWSLQTQVVSSEAAPRLNAVLAEEVSPVERLEFSGEFAVNEGGRVQPIAIGPFETDSSPYLGPDRLPSHLAVVQLRLTGRIGNDAPVVLWVDGAPIPLFSGVSVDTAFGHSVNCSGFTCGSAFSPAGDDGQPRVDVAWEGVATLWPLDPSIDQRP